MMFERALELQEAVYARLAAALSVPVYDAVPAGLAPTTYVLIGAESLRDLSDSGGSAAQCELTLQILSRAEGFAEAKAVAAQIYAALTQTPDAEEGEAVAPLGLRFLGAKAQRSIRGGCAVWR